MVAGMSLLAVPIGRVPTTTSKTTPSIARGRSSATLVAVSLRSVGVMERFANRTPCRTVTILVLQRADITTARRRLVEQAGQAMSGDGADGDTMPRGDNLGSERHRRSGRNPTKSCLIRPYPPPCQNPESPVSACSSDLSALPRTSLLSGGSRFDSWRGHVRSLPKVAEVSSFRGRGGGFPHTLQSRRSSKKQTRW
jgi:hypothetical protein